MGRDDKAVHFNIFCDYGMTKKAVICHTSCCLFLFYWQGIKRALVLFRREGKGRENHYLLLIDSIAETP